MDEKTTKRIEVLGRLNRRRDKRENNIYESFYIHLVKESTEPYKSLLEKLSGRIVKVCIELEDGQ